MNRVIIGSDIYHKTNPNELNRFKTFIEKTKPYDIVIDGLNLIYIQKNDKSMSQVVLYSCLYLKNKNLLSIVHSKNYYIFYLINLIGSNFFLIFICKKSFALNINN